LAKVRDGDVIRLDSHTGALTVQVPEEAFAHRSVPTPMLEHNQHGMGRDLFRMFRTNAATAEEGGGVCYPAATT
jgi:phosphogluconate dehydratase